MAFVKLLRPWYLNGRYYDKSSGVEIPDLEDLASAAGKSVEDFLPKGAEIVGAAAPALPATHPTVTTLSELAKAPAVDAIAASKSPAAVSNAEAKSEDEDDELDLGDVKGKGKK